MAMIFRNGSRADKLNIPAGERGLEYICRIECSLCRARADYHVYLIYEKDIFIRRGNLFYHLFESVLKFAPVFCSCKHRTHIKSNDMLMQKRLGSIARRYPCGKSFGNSRFSHARLADKTGIIFRFSAEYLKHSRYFFISAHHRIEPAAVCCLHKVSAVERKCRGARRICLIRLRLCFLFLFIAHLQKKSSRVRHKLAYHGALGYHHLDGNAVSLREHGKKQMLCSDQTLPVFCRFECRALDSATKPRRHI